MSEPVKPNDAHTDYGTAKDYVQSAYALMASEVRVKQPNDLTFFLSFHQLCGFATELYLKSLLRFQGHPEKELKGKSGHDLSHLLALSQGYGFSDKGADFLVHVFGEQHGTFEYRYLKPDSKFEKCDIAAVFDAFSTLDIAVDTQIGASRAYGKKPEGAWVFPKTLSVWRH